MATIRLATRADAAAIAAIYAPYCESTVVSFEEIAPSAEEMARRIASVGATRPWIVLEQDSGVIGYAYASAHRKGAGRALYTTLFALLHRLGYRQATAGITMPNPASVALHMAFGFAPVGVYRDIGYKMGAWHDVGWYQAEIQPAAERPAEPRPICEIVNTPEWYGAFERGLAQYKKP
jgi:phosphinothricin acetyltransferase